MNSLKNTYIQAKTAFRIQVRSMSRNKRRKNLEKEAAYLINHIEKYNIAKYPELLEYAAFEIEKFKSLGK